MKHGYGCPYHYGPIDYGPEAPNDRGENCRCEVCVEPEYVVETKTLRSAVRVPLLLRWRYRWWRWRRRHVLAAQAELFEEIERAIDQRLLYGEPEPLAERLAPYSIRTPSRLAAAARIGRLRDHVR